MNLPDPKIEKTQEQLLERAAVFAQSCLAGAEAGHDWPHTLRVWRNSRRILKGESADAEIVELAAIFHDIADVKFHGGDEEKGPALAAEFLMKEGFPEDRTVHVCNIIRHMSFKGGNEKPAWSSFEMEIVQDADRLDAIGAIGVARAFHYGGFRNRPLYDPLIAPNLKMSKAEHRRSDSPTLNHFYEKLLLLKERMHTGTARTIAEKRHAFLEQFLHNFLEEWND